MDEGNGAMVNGALMALGVVEKPHGAPRGRSRRSG